MGTNYGFRGKELSWLNAWEYFGCIDIVPVDSIAGFSNAYNRYDFDSNHPLFKQYVQKLRTKFHIVYCYPARFPINNCINTMEKYAAWHAIYLRPWDYRRYAPDIRWATFEKWCMHCKSDAASLNDKLRCHITHNISILGKLSKPHKNIASKWRYQYSDELDKNIGRMESNAKFLRDTLDINNYDLNIINEIEATEKTIVEKIIILEKHSIAKYN